MDGVISELLAAADAMSDALQQMDDFCDSDDHIELLNAYDAARARVVDFGRIALYITVAISWCIVGMVIASVLIGCVSIGPIIQGEIDAKVKVETEQDGS